MSAITQTSAAQASRARTPDRQTPPAESVTRALWSTQVAREHVARTEALLSALDTLPDSAARHATETVRALVGLYGECLARIMNQFAEVQDPVLTDRVVEDELVSHLLLVHDLHPHPVESRARRAVDAAATPLRSRGCEAELLEVTRNEARVRIIGSGCGSSTDALERAVKDAFAQAVPEIGNVTIVREERRALIPVESLFPRRSESTGGGSSAAEG